MLIKLPRKVFVLFIINLLSFIPYDGFSEGTKQIRPLSSEYGALRITTNTATGFASYNAIANYRLYIHIANVNEMILFGMHRSTNTNRNFQLKDPNGVTVLSGLCPNAVADSGYIPDYNTACIGPYFSSGGYHPLKYQVLTGSPLGDYYIQFSGTIDFDLFDFQVVNGSHFIAVPGDAIDGRVFSQAWQFYAPLAIGGPNPAPAEPFSGKIYVLSDDGIVTSCKFKDMNIGECSIFCNPYGCLNTGNFNTDRQSKNAPNTSPSFPGIAQYKVFLNDPDPLVYPDGFYGALVGQPTYPYIENDPAYPICSGRKIIYINVNKAGNVDILITVPFGSPVTDVSITTTVVPGINQILWDGKDGTGTLVPDGTPVNIHITYVNGLTNLPLWDIETNPKGFEITLIRPMSPSGQTPNSFWDDSQLTVVTIGNPCLTPPTGTNFTGCVPGSIPLIPGCHPWLTSGTVCHDKMINTWWYSASTSQASLGIVQIVTPPPPTVIGNFDRCGPGVVNLVALVLSGEIVRWFDVPSGGTALGTSNSGAPFSQTIISAGTYTYYAEAYNPTPPYFCTSDTRTPVVVHAIAIPNPPTASNPPFYNCGNGNVTLTVVPQANINIEWYDAAAGGNLIGIGNSFTTPFLTTTTSYYAQAVNVTYPTTCSSTSRTLVIAEIRPSPVVTFATTAEGICSGASPTIILGSSPPGASFSWIATNPDGNVNGYTVFGSGNLTGEVLNINAGVYLSGTVTYTVTPTLASCQGNSTQFDITVRPYPDISFPAPSTTTICSGAPTTITLASQVANTTYNWSATGYSANITPGPSVSGSANPIAQVFDHAGHSVEAVTFEIIPSAAGCTSPATPFTILVNPVPGVVLPNPAEQTTCSNAPSSPVNLGTDVTGTPVDYSWTTSCGPGITNCPAGGFGSAPAAIPSESLVNTTFLQQNAVYSVTASIGACAGPTAGYTIRVNPVADVLLPASPPNPQIICSGQQTIGVPLNSSVTTMTVDYNWTVSCETGIPACPPAGSGSTIPPTGISNTDIVPKLATWAITPSVGGCAGLQTTYQVQVNPSPTVNNSPMFQEICSGTASTPVQLTANVSPTTFQWTATPSSGAITGFMAGPVTGDIPAQTLFNASNAQGFVNYHIIPSSQSGMPCPGAPADYKIFVNPLPVPVITGPLQVCYDQSGSTYSTPGIANHDYLWTVTGAVSFTGNNTSSITVDWGPGPAGTVRVTEIDQSHTTNCSTTTPVYNVIINPAPTPVITAIPASPASPCGNTTVTYSLGPPQANHSYQWTISGGNPAAGTGAGIAVTWGNTNPVSVNVVESITYAPGVVCSAPATKAVTLNLIPDAAGAISGPPAVCQSPALQYIYSVPAINNADSYTWTYVPSTGVNIINNGVTASLSFSASSASGNLFVHGNKTGCASGPQSPGLPITVNALPLVSLAACFDPVTSISARPFLLKGGTPLGAGGKYYVDGNLATGNILDPATLGVGSHIISFTYTDANTCEASDAKTITVLGANPPCGNTMTDHRDIPPTTYKTAFLGGKCWMTENLRYGTKVVTPTQVQPRPQTDNCVNEKYCLATDDAGCTTYGGLYQWDELIQYGQTQAPFQGLCPPGWHIPAAAEWQALIDDYQGNGIAGGLMQNAGFDALSMGIFYLNNLWAFTTADNLNATMFWTSTLAGNKPVARGLNVINPSVSIYESPKANAFSVRCVKD